MDGTTFAIGGFVGALVVTAVAVFAWRGHRTRELVRLRAIGVKTDAEIVSSFKGGTGSELCIEYRFTTQIPSTVFTRTEVLGGAYDDLPSKGQKISVLYDPADPNVSRIALEPHPANPRILTLRVR